MSKREWVLVGVCLLAGFIGGRVADWATAPEGAGTSAQVPGGAPILTISGLRLVDTEGKTRATLDVAPNGQAGLTLCDQNQVCRTRLFTNADGTSMLGLWNNGDKFSALLRQSNGRPDFMLMDKDGNMRLGMCVTPEGLAGLYLNQNNRQCLWVNAPAQGAPNISLHDSEGRSRAHMSLEADGSPLLRLLDKDGTPVFNAP